MGHDDYTLWYADNRKFLDDNNIKPAIAEMIWYSAKTSVMHTVAQSIAEGSLKIDVTF